MVKNDFHPAKTALVVFGQFETNVFRFVHRKKVAVFIK